MNITRDTPVSLGMLPEYLKPFADWTGPMFYRDAINHGYTRAQAQRFVRLYLHLLGKEELRPAEVLGWIPLRSPLLKDGGKLAFLYRQGRRRFQYFTEQGKKLGPEQPHLAAACAWADANDWYMA